MHANEFRNVLSLSEREHEVFVLIGKGKRPCEVASELKRSLKTIETHICNIKRKLQTDHYYAFMRSAVRYDAFCESTNSQRRLLHAECQPKYTFVSSFN